MDTRDCLHLFRLSLMEIFKIFIMCTECLSKVRKSVEKTLGIIFKWYTCITWPTINLTNGLFAKVIPYRHP